MQTGVKKNIHNDILELSLTRSIVRKPQSFEDFRRICPVEVQASTKARLSEKVNSQGFKCLPPPPLKFLGTPLNGE